jgi:DNA repair protein RadD
LRVDYRCGFNEYHSEWICVAHPKGSYAWQKASTWWQARSSEPMPDTVEQAVELAEAGALAQPLSITVRSVTGEKFDRITNYELGSIPPHVDGSDEREPVASATSPDQPWTEWPDDDIPF